MRPTLTLSLAAVLLAVPASPARAGQSFDNCSGFIDSLPATIATQGVWCLRADLSTALTSGNAITVSANNVTIDCNDYKLGGLAGGSATFAYGVYSTRLNTTVRNCNVRGFYVGIGMAAGAGHLVEGNRFDANTVAAISARGDGSIVRDNLILDTGGSSVNGEAVGIEASGNVTIVDNVIANIVPALSTGYGIYLFFGDSGIVRRNRIHGVSGTGGAAAYGIYTTSAGSVFLRDNDFHGTGAANSVAIRCANNQGTAGGNFIARFETAVENCLSEGNTINPN